MANRVPLKENQRLLLRDRPLAARMVELFAELDVDLDRQRSFIDSPAQALDIEVNAQGSECGDTAMVNRFLHSALSDDSLSTWAAEYDRTHPGVSETQRLNDLAYEMVRCADPSLTPGLLEHIRDDAAPGRSDPTMIFVKQESITTGSNYFFYKLTQHEEEVIRLPASKIQRIGQQLMAQARKLTDASEK